jgi:hypothetical protein
VQRQGIIFNNFKHPHPPLPPLRGRRQGGNVQRLSSFKAMALQRTDAEKEPILGLVCTEVLLAEAAKTLYLGKR